MGTGRWGRGRSGVKGVVDEALIPLALDLVQEIRLRCFVRAWVVDVAQVLLPGSVAIPIKRIK